MEILAIMTLEQTVVPKCVNRAISSVVRGVVDRVIVLFVPITSGVELSPFCPFLQVANLVSHGVNFVHQPEHVTSSGVEESHGGHAQTQKVRITGVLMLTQRDDVLMRRVDIRIDLVLSFCQIVEPVPQVPRSHLSSLMVLSTSCRSTPILNRKSEI